MSHSIREELKKNVKRNLKDFLHRPAALATEIDFAWPDHAKRALIESVLAHRKEAKDSKERKERGTEAKTWANKNYDTLGDATPTYDDLLAQLGTFEKRFMAIGDACRVLEQFALELGKKEFMVKSQRGQTAFFATSQMFHAISKEAHKAHDGFVELGKQLKVPMGGDRCTKEHFVEVRAHLGRYDGYETVVRRKIESAAEECRAAIEFETVKAFVVAVLEKSPEDPDRWARRLQEIASAASRGLSTASSHVPSEPGSVLSAASAFVAVGTSEVNKVLTAARRKHRVSAILSKSDSRDVVVQSMNRDPLIMAQYLHEKNLANLDRSFTAMEPLIYGGTLLINAAPVPVPIGDLLGRAWSWMVESIKSTVATLGENRIALARKKLAPVSGLPEVPAAATAVVASFTDKVKSLVPDVAERALDFAIKHAGTSLEGLAMEKIRPLVFDRLVACGLNAAGTAAAVDPAQAYTGDEFEAWMMQLPEVQGAVGRALM